MTPSTHEQCYSLWLEGMAPRWRWKSITLMRSVGLCGGGAVGLLHTLSAHEVATVLHTFGEHVDVMVSVHYSTTSS